MTLPPAVLAFRLLDGSGLEHQERQLVLTAVDYTKTDTMFVQMTQALRKFFGKQSVPATGSSASGGSIKLEPSAVFMSEEDDTVYYTRGSGQRGRRNYGGRGRWRSETPRGAVNNSRYTGYRGGGTYRGGYQSYRGGYQSDADGKSKRTYNPTGSDGATLKCAICESVFHFARNCPDSYENLRKNGTHEEAVLFTGNKVNEMQVLVSESINAAILDSACSSTVTGEAWIKCYLDTLSNTKLHQVVRESSDAVFRFGGGTRLMSQEKVTFPCELAGVKCTITTDVVASDIPLLLGKPAMKAAKVVLDLEHDKASIFGQNIDLQCTSSGHYCVPLGDTSTPIEDTFSVLFNMDEKSVQDKQKIISKLHKQFAHPTGRRLRLLLKDAGVTDEDCFKLIDDITQACDTCHRFRKTPSKPVVGLPLATEFNEVVAMDLKEWKPGTYFLHLVDMATRFSLAGVIKNKLPSTIINKVMILWIGSGLGTPRKFLADNGGEFANEAYKDMAENLNIEVCNTAGFSPWQNGICERNHAVVDDCVKKILDDHPDTDLETALVWAIHAKNSLQMVHGWSSYQLVFGRNPNLPSIMNDRPPALEGTTSNEIFAKHLNTLHAGRQAFTRAESSERIRRALRYQIRSSDTAYQIGDKVYYRRNGQWKGPGKVLGQDGKVIFVRHGSTYVRVSPCQLIKEGDEFKKSHELQKSVTQVQDPVSVTPQEQTYIDEDDDDDEKGHMTVPATAHSA